MTVGVIGATGELGSAIIRRGICGSDGAPARVLHAGRRQSPTTPDERFRRVDINELDTVRALAEECHLVISAIGPSHATALGIARTVLAAGADYLDVGGPKRHRELSEVSVPADRCALFHAGALPGAADVLPRWLVRQVDREAAGAKPGVGDRALTVTVGGCGAFTVAGAIDYLAGLTSGEVQPGAGWCAGRVVPGAAAIQTRVDLPEFPDEISLYPYLDAPSAEFAAEARLDEATWFAAMVGEGAAEVIRSACGMPLEEGAQLLHRFTTAQTAGRRPYVVALADMAGCKAVLRAPGEPALAGAMAAASAAAILAGEAPRGTALPAAAALEPEALMDRILADSGARADASPGAEERGVESPAPAPLPITLALVPAQDGGEDIEATAMEVGEL